jgi:hypothetical protein
MGCKHVPKLFHWLRKSAGQPAEGPNRNRHTPDTGRQSVPVVAPGAGRPSAPKIERRAGIGPDVATKLDLLVRRSWGSREDNQTGNFAFDTALVPAGGADVFAATLLKHVRLVAPRLNIPFMTPRIEVSTPKGSCGQFIEEDGWVKLVVSTEFALDSAASRAILCQELSHYILFANGIRMADRTDNERLTDVAMFVLGIGNIFLYGFRSKNVGFRQRGHRIGYLTDTEYNFLSAEVIRLRTTGELQLESETELRGRLLNRPSDNKPMLERYLACSQAVSDKVRTGANSGSARRFRPW